MPPKLHILYLVVSSAVSLNKVGNAEQICVLRACMEEEEEGLALFTIVRREARGFCRFLHPPWFLPSVNVLCHGWVSHGWA